MVDRVEITNFRCFRELRVDLRPLTVAIGKNNTGKTTFLSAIAEAAPVGRRPVADRFHGVGDAGVIVLSEPANLWRIDLPVSGPAMWSKGVGESAAVPPIEVGVPTVLDWILRNDRPRFDRIEAAIRQSVPGVTSIHLITPNPADRVLDLTWEGGWRDHADAASAGVRLVLYFLTLAWHPTPPELILVEEPETGLHPGRLREVMDLLRGLTEGRYGRATQVVLTTHSPLLLDCVRPEVDQVLVFERKDDGSCGATALDRDRLAPFLRDFALGELWTNDGEDLLVGRS